MQERLFFSLSIHICWGGEMGGGHESDGIPPAPQDTAAFSACVNKASLNCLIILCKLWDQGTLWKHSAECVCGPCLQKLLFYLHTLFFRTEINPDGFWWCWGLKDSLLIWTPLFWVLDFSWAQIKLKKEKSLFITSVTYISLLHKLTLNECLFSLGTIFAALDGCILHTLLIKHVLELLSGTTHILISIMQHPE